MRYFTENKRPSRITVPPHAHPLVKFIYAEMRRQGVTYEELEWRSGVLRSTSKAWRTHNRGGLESIESCLGALGFQMTVAPAEEATPEAIRAELRAMAEKHGMSAWPALEYLAEFTNGWSYPGCPIAERRLHNLQQHERHPIQ